MKSFGKYKNATMTKDFIPEIVSMSNGVCEGCVLNVFVGVKQGSYIKFIELTHELAVSSSSCLVLHVCMCASA